MKRLLQAAFIAPMDGPVQRDGAVVIDDGRIVSLGPAAAMRTAHPDAAAIDLGAAVILPGLVNAHTHLELSGCTPAEGRCESFGDWILGIRARMARAGEDPGQAIERGVRAGIDQCLAFGVTTVGDISQQYAVSRPILRASPLRAVSYGEALGLAQVRDKFDRLLAGAADASLASDRLRIGLSPHAPYTVDVDGYRQALALARERGFPLATHLAETPDEAEFLIHQRGAFRRVWETLGTWADCVPLMPRPPIEMAEALGLLAYPTLLAHVNYCDEDDLARLARGRASVVYCPRTHRYFGHPPHRWREMLARGINVALGTDSCASSPDLNLLDDLRLVHEQAPEHDAIDLWRMVTIRAARALGWDDQIGTITPGKAADLVAFPVRTDYPLRELLETPSRPSLVLIAGEPAPQQQMTAKDAKS